MLLSSRPFDQDVNVIARRRSSLAIKTPGASHFSTKPPKTHKRIRYRPATPHGELAKRPLRGDFPSPPSVAHTLDQRDASSTSSASALILDLWRRVFGDRTQSTSSTAKVVVKTGRSHEHLAPKSTVSLPTVTSRRSSGKRSIWNTLTSALRSWITGYHPWRGAKAHESQPSTNHVIPPRTHNRGESLPHLNSPVSKPVANAHTRYSESSSQNDIDTAKKFTATIDARQATSARIATITSQHESSKELPVPQTSSCSTPSSQHTGSGLPHFSPRLHDLTRAFRNTPISSNGTRGHLQRKTLGLVKPKIRSDANMGISTPSDSVVGSDPALAPLNILLPHEVRLKDHLRKNPPSGLGSISCPLKNDRDIVHDRDSRGHKDEDWLDTTFHTSQKMSFMPDGLLSRQSTGHDETKSGRLAPEFRLLLPHEQAARVLLERRRPSHNTMDNKTSRHDLHAPAQSIGRMLTMRNDPSSASRDRNVAKRPLSDRASSDITAISLSSRSQDIHWDSLVPEFHSDVTQEREGSGQHNQYHIPTTQGQPTNGNHHSRRTISRRPITQYQPTITSANPIIQVASHSLLSNDNSFWPDVDVRSYESRARDNMELSPNPSRSSSSPTQPVIKSNTPILDASDIISPDVNHRFHGKDSDKTKTPHRSRASTYDPNDDAQQDSRMNMPTAMSHTKRDRQTVAGDVRGRKSIRIKAAPSKNAVSSHSPQRVMEYDNQLDFSWDSWTDETRIPREMPEQMTSSRGVYARWEESRHPELLTSILNEVNIDNEERSPRVTSPVDPTSGKPQAHPLQNIAKAYPDSSMTSGHRSDVPLDPNTLEGWDQAKQVRSRSRKSGRGLRYIDDIDTITEDHIHNDKAHDRDRTKDKDHSPRVKAKKAVRETEYENSDDWEDEWEKRQQRKRDKRLRQEQGAFDESAPKIPQISIPEFIAVEDLGRALDLSPIDLARALVDFGFDNLTIKSVLTGETAGLIAQEYGFEAIVEAGRSRDIKPLPPAIDSSLLSPRPPVVTIMGHVDHGKTTMLDHFRKTSTTATESGGITQHIGAFQVLMSSGKTITFLDTPGHAAFLAMRQRGANATDIVVLVVAADDSVKPQTIEAINHAQTAKVPMIVAINKIDKPGARPDIVKADLARAGVDLEENGGDVQVVYTSGRTGAGMADLEENILTLAEILDFRAETDGQAEGWIIESSIKQIGKSAVVLVKRGTLHVGDIVVAGTSWARIRLLRDDAGCEIEEALPGTPAEIIGWNDTLPDTGTELLQASDESKARSAIAYRLEMLERSQNIDEAEKQEKRRKEDEARKTEHRNLSDAEVMSVNSSLTSEPGPKIINFIIKSDVAGSAEAVSGSIMQLGNHEVRPRILRSAVGAVTEWDVEHAAISASSIICFNTPASAPIRHMAQREGVNIIEHTIIYRLADDVKALLSSHLADKVTYRVVGEAEILEIFAINIRGRLFYKVAGCRVRNGMVIAGAAARIMRRGAIIFDGK
jgi:translation initiation factor IF-2